MVQTLLIHSVFKVGFHTAAVVLYQIEHAKLEDYTRRAVHCIWGNPTLQPFNHLRTFRRAALTTEQVVVLIASLFQAVAKIIRSRFVLSRLVTMLIAC